MVGNGVCDAAFDGDALVSFVHGMGLISGDLYQVKIKFLSSRFLNNIIIVRIFLATNMCRKLILPAKESTGMQRMTTA